MSWRHEIIERCEERRTQRSDAIASRVEEFMDAGCSFEEATTQVHGLTLTRFDLLAIAWNRLLIDIVRPHTPD